MRLVAADGAALRSASAAYDLVVTLGSGGIERRYAERSFAVSTRAGTGGSVQVDGGLLSAEAPSRAASVRDATVRAGGDVPVKLADDGFTWLRLLAQRAPIQGMQVEVAFVAAEHGDWEDRQVLYVGALRKPAWDLREGTVSFEVAQVTAEGRGRVPDRVVSEDTFAASVPGSDLQSSAGSPMPVVYGLCLDVVPVPIKVAADDNRVLVASHKIAGVISILRDNADGAASAISIPAVSVGVDDRGGLYSYCVLTDAQYFSAGTPYVLHAYVSGKVGGQVYYGAGGGAGGAYGALATTGFNTLGQVLLDLLLTYSNLPPERIDADSFRHFDSAVPLTVAVQIATEDWTLSWAHKIAEHMPCALGWFGGKLRLVPHSVSDESPVPVAASFTWGRGLLDLLSPYEEESVDEVVNDVLVRYYYRNRVDAYQSAIALNPDTDPECKESAARYGRRGAGSSLDLWQVVDDATAMRVAREYVARMAHVRTRATYLVDARQAAALDPLQVVEVVDPEQGSNPEQRWIVEEVQPQDDWTTILRLATFRELGR